MQHNCLNQLGWWFCSLSCRGGGGVLEGFGLINKIHYSLFRSLIKKEIKSYTVTLLEKMFKNHSNATWIIIAKKESASNCL